MHMSDWMKKSQGSVLGRAVKRLTDLPATLTLTEFLIHLRKEQGTEAFFETGVAPDTTDATKHMLSVRRNLGRLPIVAIVK